MEDLTMTPAEQSEMENGIPYRYGQALELLKMVLDEERYGGEIHRMAVERARAFVAGEEARLDKGAR